jgi:hypothetical protein
MNWFKNFSDSFNENQVSFRETKLSQTFSEKSYKTLLTCKLQFYAVSYHQGDQKIKKNHQIFQRIAQKVTKSLKGCG